MVVDTNSSPCFEGISSVRLVAAGKRRARFGSFIAQKNAPFGLPSVLSACSSFCRTRLGAFTGL